MIRKKRALMWICAIALVALGYKFGWIFALAGFVLFAVLLGVVMLVRTGTANKGMKELETCALRFNTEKLAAQARERVAAQLKETQGGFKFAVLGDSRDNVRIAKRVYEAAAAENPAMIFHTGDIVRNGSALSFLQSHVPLVDAIAPVPMICVPGNHDRGARRDFSAYEALYGSDRFAFECGPCLYVGFNNSRRGRVTDDDMAFVGDALRNSSAQWKYLFYHIPPAFFEKLIVNDERRRGFKDNADALHGLCKEWGVTEVFMSHIHGYASEVIDGVRYTLTAGAGAPLARRLAKEGQVYHYVVVHIGPNGPRREMVYFHEGTWIRRADG